MDRDKKSKMLLRTWKEISNYLDCDVRTCIRWEKRYKLPVHRIDDSVKSRVFAYEEELDNWLQKRTKNSSYTHNSFFTSFLFQKPIFFIAFIIMAVSLVIVVLSLIKSSSRNPVNFKISNSQLIILDEENRELWTYNTEIVNLSDDKAYRTRFQFQRRIEGQDYLPHILIRDFDQDGKSDVLFSTQTQDEYGEGELLCFDNAGKIMWKYTAGKELKFGDNVYSPDYRITGISVHDFDADGLLEIIVISAHRHFYPTQLSILSSDGELIGEYWNSGRISDLEIVDLNGDGKEEIVISGCNNEYGKACLIVLDPEQVRGCSPQNPDYRCRLIEEGKEMYYILFPRTEIDIQVSPVESIRTLEKLKNNRLSLRTTHSQIIYELDYSLALRDIRFSHAYEMRHKEAIKEGKIIITLADEYERLKEEGLLYYNGENWVRQPMMTSYWKR